MRRLLLPRLLQRSVQKLERQWDTDVAGAEGGTPSLRTCLDTQRVIHAVECAAAVDTPPDTLPPRAKRALARVRDAVRAGLDAAAHRDAFSRACRREVAALRVYTGALQRQMRAQRTALPHCRICMSAADGRAGAVQLVALAPCQHVVCCVECCAHLDACPVCRGALTGWHRVFLS